MPTTFVRRPSLEKVYQDPVFIALLHRISCVTQRLAILMHR